MIIESKKETLRKATGLYTCKRDLAESFRYIDVLVHEVLGNNANKFYLRFFFELGGKLNRLWRPYFDRLRFP